MARGGNRVVVWANPWPPVTQDRLSGTTRADRRQLQRRRQCATRGGRTRRERCSGTSRCRWTASWRDGTRTSRLFSPTIGRQLLERGLIDEIDLHLAPVLLGEGIRLFDNPGGRPVRLERVNAIPAASHRVAAPVSAATAACDREWRQRALCRCAERPWRGKSPRHPDRNQCEAR